MSIAAGELNRRITFQLLPPANGAKNSFGELTAEPTDHITNVPAKFKPQRSGRAREFEESEKRHSETQASFIIRYRNDINPQTLPETHRITWLQDSRTSSTPRVFDIQAVDEIGTHEGFEIFVSEIR
jgi:head-tail adaptor